MSYCMFCMWLAQATDFVFEHVPFSSATCVGYCVACCTLLFFNYSLQLYLAQMKLTLFVCNPIYTGQPVWVQVLQSQIIGRLWMSLMDFVWQVLLVLQLVDHSFSHWWSETLRLTPSLRFHAFVCILWGQTLWRPGISFYPLLKYLRVSQVTDNSETYKDQHFVMSTQSHNEGFSLSLSLF